MTYSIDPIPSIFPNFFMLRHPLKESTFFFGGGGGAVQALCYGMWAFSSCGVWAYLPQGMWDLISPTRDRTHIPSIGSTES